MPSEPSAKSGQSPSNEGEKHKHLDREIREMVSAITHRVTDFHKSDSTHHLENDDERDVRIITLAGTNDGATLKSDLDEKSGKTPHGEPEALSTFVNSNFQAINNSIMFGGSYQANDPGVHLDISDFTDPPHSHHHHKVDKQGKKGKKKEKEGSKSEH
ncbi:uncharacterized protein LOC113853177 [Abrus precatorius]|uniref:Uncharacterized protein LOC113853177 n=1 Tax=Abrus precatorius TaxID=3816 RepID=A0A8B8K6S7_ABRPR|nr:uncharacterized protein LOC113853177 [Abrus precatorius]